MSERTHSPAMPGKTNSKRKLTVIAAGTGTAILLGAVALQVFRAEDGVAAQEPAPNAAGTARVAPTQRPLARVGNDLVTWETIAQECMVRHGKDVLDNIINRTIIHQECQRRGIEVSKAEVEAEINRIAKRFNLDTPAWYAMLQSERNLSAEQYQRDVIWPMLALKKLAGEQIQLTPKDIDEAYVRDYGPRVQAKMIMLDNTRRATEVHEMARANPDDFERLAQDHSVEPNSRALGGAIPPIRRYAGTPQLEDAAFKLKPGEISPVVQVGVAGQSRFVILKCEGQTQPVAVMEEVREQLVQDLQEEKVQQAVAKIFDDLKKQTRVDNYLTNMVSGGVEQASATATPRAPRTAGAPAPQGSARTGTAQVPAASPR